MHFHAKGEEEFIISQTNLIYVESFFINTKNETGITIAEVSVTSAEYQIVEFDGSNCKQYSTADGTHSDFEEFQICAKAVFRSYYMTNLTCPVAGFVNTTDIVKPEECSNNDSAAESFKAMKYFTTTFSMNPESYGCPKPCRTSSFKALMHTRVDKRGEQGT